MSREIKFRAWDKIRKIWIHIMSIQWFSGKEGCVADGTHSYPFSDIELIQFTGLKDKNDKEIYEGDIVRTPDIADNLWEIYWHINGFCLGRKRKDKSVLDWPTDENGYVCYGRSWVDIEVLGNIYENPELLEEGK